GCSRTNGSTWTGSAAGWTGPRGVRTWSGGSRGSTRRSTPGWRLSRSGSERGRGWGRGCNRRGPGMGAVGWAGNFRPGCGSGGFWLHLLFIQWPISLAPALFTFLLPGLLGYARGGMAWVGAAVAAAFTVLLPLQGVFATWAEWYPRLHPWLFGVFYVYALAGLALCGAGIFDGKRSAVWALLAVLSLLAGAVARPGDRIGRACSPP